MATITLTAVPGHHEREPDADYSMRVIEICGTELGRLQAEAKTLDAVRALVKHFGQAVAARHPDRSFMVLAGVAKGSRKPAGFDDANRGNGLGQEAWMKTLAGRHGALAA